VIPLYATGGLLFLPVAAWFSLLPLLSVVAAGLVGPPIGIFVYRTFRRRDAVEAPVEPAVELAWLKGEMLGSWTPLLVSIAVLGSLGVGMRALPEPVAAPPPRPPAPPALAELVELLPSLRAAVEADSADPNARRQLGAALFSLGRFESAAAELGVAVGLDSSSVESWRALGRALYYAGFPRQSARAYWNVLRLDPSSLNAAGLDRVVLDAALSSDIVIDTVPETIN
jgi:tetratricopeptide (TPR) repeat protein